MAWLLPALRFAWQPRDPDQLREPRPIGLLAGLTGTGGGVVAVHLRQLALRSGWPAAGAWIRRCLALAG
jgi:hypothetical protein